VVQITRSLCSLRIRIRYRAKRRFNHTAPSALQTDLPVAVEERPVAPPAGPSADVAVHVSPLCGAGAHLTDRVAIHLQRGAQQGAYGELVLNGQAARSRRGGPPPACPVLGDLFLSSKARATATEKHRACASSLNDVEESIAGVFS
jgi:hypothetical protein